MSKTPHNHILPGCYPDPPGKNVADFDWFEYCALDGMTA